MAWTDYPIGSDNSIKQVELVRYDRNKYALVKFGEEFKGIKSGYLFQDSALTRHMTAMALYALPIHDEDRAHTRLEVVNALRKEMRRQTTYALYVGKKRFRYTNLDEALAKLAPVILKEECHLSRHQKKNYSYISEPLINSEDGYFSRFRNSKQRVVLKTSHLKKMGIY